MKPELFWHFLRSDCRLRYKPRRPVTPGKTFRMKGDVKLCERGFHASRRLFDACNYAPGPILCRVTLGGTIIDGHDKVVAQERTVLWMFDASAVLHRFALQLAAASLRAKPITGKLFAAALRVKRQWLAGKATEDELNLARSKLICDREGFEVVYHALSPVAHSAAWYTAETIANVAGGGFGGYRNELDRLNDKLERMVLHEQKRRACK